MKKVILVCLLFVSAVAVSGCSLQEITQWIENKTTAVVKQDQQHEQGYVLTTGDVYAAYDTGLGYLRLENKGLTAVPDFCSLLLPEDHPRIRAITLMQNNIRIINTDLSCLVNLRSLNLSYNEVEVVQTLGSLPNLQELRLHKNNITTTEDFPDFPALTKLTLAFNQLKDIDGIDHLKSLVVLELHHNVLEKLDGIEQLQQLEQLKIEYNQLKDEQISPLMDTLDKLSLLTAKGNELKSDLLNRLDQLNSLWIQNNMRGQMSGEVVSGDTQ